MVVGLVLVGLGAITVLHTALAWVGKIFAIPCVPPFSLVAL